MSNRPDDLRWLTAAARLSMRGRPLSRPNPSVGCIIVNNGVVVGRGWTKPGGRPHAEAVALEHAGAKVRGGTAYVTLEPCAHQSTRGPACADLLAEAGLEGVVIGQADPDPRTAGKGVQRLRDAGITVEIADDPACAASLAGYLTQKSQGRPQVTLKLAASSDGRIAVPAGSDKWITGEEARAHVHARRAQYDAICVGAGTWREDQPRLDVRLPGLEDRSPERYVLTRSESVDGAKPLASPQAIHGLTGVLYFYLEGGAGAAKAFLDAGLVDRIDLYQAPHEIGSGEDALANLGLSDLDQHPDKWTLIESRQLGSDTYRAYQRRR